MIHLIPCGHLHYELMLFQALAMNKSKTRNPFQSANPIHRGFRNNDIVVSVDHSREPKRKQAAT